MAASVLMACSRPSPTVSVEPPIAMVAASTKDAVESVIRAFGQIDGETPKLIAAGSNTLATQIAHGAPADVFLSADEAWVDDLATKGLVIDSVPLLSNRLVIAVRKDSKLRVAYPKDLANAERIGLAGENVPAGRYAKAALEHYGMYGAIGKKVVRGQDVRSVLTYIERGEVDAAVVYATDVMASKDLIVAFTFPQKSHPPIVYPLALVRDRAQARSLYEFLQTDASLQVFESMGFTRIE